MTTGTIKSSPTTKEEWTSIRSKTIGGSEIATIIGVNPYKTPFDLWEEKTGRVPPFEGNELTMIGTYLEDGVAKLWEEITGKVIIKDSAKDYVYHHPEYQFLTGTPDRRYWDLSIEGEDNHGILEVKTTQMEVDYDPVTLHGIPQSWFCQLQWYLGLTGYKRGAIAWLERGRSVKNIEVDFVKEFFDGLVASAVDFMEKHLIPDIPPEPINSKDVEKMFPGHDDDKIIEADDEMISQWEKLKEVKEKEKILEAEKKILEEKIKLQMRDASIISYKGQSLFTWRQTIPRKEFDKKAFEADNPELYQTYVREKAGYRMFLVK